MRSIASLTNLPKEPEALIAAYDALGDAINELQTARSKALLALREIKRLEGIQEAPDAHPA